MSSAVETTQYTVPSGTPSYGFSCAPHGLELERLTPPRSASDHSFLLPTHPSTPQEFIPGNSYYLHSPAHTPYLEGSPPSDRQNFESNHELRLPPRSGMFMKEEDEISLLGGPYLSGDYSMDGRSGDRVFETWDETVEHTLPSPTPSAEDCLRGLSGSPESKQEDKPASKSKVSRAPRKRKTPGDKPDKPKLPKLIKPLSELTQEYHDLPIRNMESWVNRSAETRWKEVEKRGGYVTRPMNSFMLYRSAFAERTKMWCLQNNHQVVSSVSGESWPLEPEEIRQKYNELARIERVNHQAAHPGYKFSPSKALNNRKRKGSKPDDDTASAISELDDFDSLGGGHVEAASPDPRPAKKPQRNRRRAQKASDLCGGTTGSSQATPPVNMGTQDMSGQYYQTTVRASPVTPLPNPLPTTVIEDVTIRKTPGGNAPQIKTEPATDNSKVDPLLLGSGQEGGFLTEPYNQPNILPSHFLQDTAGGDFEFGNEQLFAGAGPMIDTGLDGFSTEGMAFSEQALMDGSIDVSKLPGYCENLGPFLDNQEPWSIEETATIGGGEGLEGADLCYDEWLQ
ncbi:hypothetical protein FN846DRAFT_918562 [Sphaerosporella brunnea]|uniref:HMG box domain-containing protein n=1 Tax=Sphaerosporella brunnea TaxID=1250544 RepID=A0A5J5EZ50_9PEZI|nr:hypothetical protein FN846DRAFT_918562 [Sphaerosporella brunnea]